MARHSHDNSFLFNIHLVVLQILIKNFNDERGSQSLSDSRIQTRESQKPGSSISIYAGYILRKLRAYEGCY